MATAVGQPITISFTIATSPAGVLFDPTTVTIEVGLFGGPVSTPTVVRDSTGTYHTTFTPMQAGVWDVRVIGKDGVGGYQAASDAVFTVRPTPLPV